MSCWRRSTPVSTTAILIRAAARSADSGTRFVFVAVYCHSYGTPTQYWSRTAGSDDAGSVAGRRPTVRAPTVEPATSTACSAGRFRVTRRCVRASSVFSACGDRYVRTRVPALWPGCDCALDAASRETTKTAASALRKAPMHGGIGSRSRDQRPSLAVPRLSELGDADAAD